MQYSHQTTHLDVIAHVTGTRYLKNVKSLSYYVNVFQSHMVATITMHDGTVYSDIDLVPQDAIDLERTEEFVFEEQLGSTPVWKIPSMSIDMDGDFVTIYIPRLLSSYIDWKETDLLKSATYWFEVQGTYLVTHPIGLQQLSVHLGQELKLEGSMGYPCLVVRAAEFIAIRPIGKRLICKDSLPINELDLELLTYDQWVEACRLAGITDPEYVLECPVCAKANERPRTLYPKGTKQCKHDGNMRFEKHVPVDHTLVRHILRKISNVFY
ncbi:hypothetical protein [Vibrio phage vB_pir03]|nr:hypothetical protein [Vibrio phage vB_pir03]